MSQTPLNPKRILINRWVGHGYLHRIIRGAASYFSQKDDWIDFTKEGPRNEDQLDGAITFLFENEDVARWKRRGIPLVNLSNRLHETGFPRICTDDREVGRLAAGYFLEQRFTRFIFYHTAPFHYVRQRREGFAKRLAEAGCEVCVCEGFDALKAAFLTIKPPTAVFGAEDEPALQAIGLAAKMGLDVPNEVAVLGTNNDETMCQLAKPPLSSIDIPGEKIGYLAGQLLDRLLHGETLEKAEYRLPPVGVIVRQSTDTIAYENAVIRKAAHLMLVNLQSPLGMGELAQRTGVSRKKMERVFRDELDTTPLTFQRNLRLDRGKHLLRATDLPISRISEMCGFSDYTKFSRFFSEQTGTSPSRWRKG